MVIGYTIGRPRLLGQFFLGNSAPAWQTMWQTLPQTMSQTMPGCRYEVLFNAAADCRLTLAGAGVADEGMWTFDNPPTKLIHPEVQKYKFRSTEVQIHAHQGMARSRAPRERAVKRRGIRILCQPARLAALVNSPASAQWTRRVSGDELTKFCSGLIELAYEP